MAEQAETNAKSGGLLQLITLVLLVVLIGLVGFLTWKLVLTPAPAQAPAKAEAEAPAPEPDAPPVYVDLGDITVNLADPDATRFLRAKIKLEVRGEKAKQKVEENLVRIHDLAITVMSNKTFAELRTAGGKYALKEELIYRINRLLGGEWVRNLFFTDFIAQ
ncbi:MAG: flagellar protein FliL [Zetaproteobacteria bacterium]|nr:MAG: flagellar protein FliL [Zetaproteobacteria bacterium]